MFMCGTQHRGRLRAGVLRWLIFFAWSGMHVSLVRWHATPVAFKLRSYDSFHLDVHVAPHIMIARRASESRRLGGTWEPVTGPHLHLAFLTVALCTT
jgi:hypothetical protein